MTLQSDDLKIIVKCEYSFFHMLICYHNGIIAVHAKNKVNLKLEKIIGLLSISWHISEWENMRVTLEKYWIHIVFMVSVAVTNRTFIIAIDMLALAHEKNYAPRRSVLIMVDYTDKIAHDALAVAW